MTKLEQKLIELGYEFYIDSYGGKVYIKLDYYTTKIILSKKITGYIDTLEIDRIDTQQQIDNLQQAFNQLQQDLEVLKKYEKKD